VRLTRDLDEAIRECEIAGIRSGIETVRRLRPEIGAAGIEVAGGLVAFTGVDSPLSQAVGIGSSAAVTDDEIARVADFYESRGATPRVFVTPLADPSLGRALAAAGYAPSEYENVLASDDFGSHALRDDRIAIATDLDAWARASAQAFTDRETLEPGDELIATIIASSEGVCPLEARDGAAVAATAAMDLRNGCAGLFAGSTMPGFRGRGWHVAMIRDRIARARDAGARLMRATARPASTSERNFQRCGFVTLYTRALWERKRTVSSA
jgi:GNAT superfamily N-acetyltransferase